MEMERINENTIRVLIENSDLEERGITFLDLLGNHKQIESFFYSILEEVDIDEQFQETDAVTFQVLPNRNGLELFISKNILMQDGESSLEAEEFVEEENSFTEFIKQQFQGTPLEENGSEKEETKNETVLTDVVMRFNDFESLIELMKNHQFYGVQSDLYKFENSYFVHVKLLSTYKRGSGVKFDISRLLEYGEMSRLSAEYISEHGKKIITDNAFETVKKNFKK